MIATFLFLSSYLETDGENATIKPWLWIAMFLVGALLKSVLENLYLSFLGKIYIRTQALLTQLMFEHSLRIRLKAEASGEKPSSQATTPSTPSILEYGKSSPIIDNTSEYGHTTRDENVTQTSSTVTASSLEASQTILKGSIKGKAKVDSKSAKIAKTYTGDTENLTGRINNLASSDLDAMMDGANFLTFGMTVFRYTSHSEGLFFFATVLFVPLQIVLSIIFLTTVLGRR